MGYKVLVADKIADEGIARLKELGCDVTTCFGMSHDELLACIGDFEALIVRSATKVDAEVIEAGKRLRVIGRAGLTVDNIDIATATEKGVIVCNAPRSNSVSVAELAISLMLSCARKTCQANESMKAHKWERERFEGTELCGKTLAIFGIGRIGALVAQRAAAFDMKLIGYDPYCSAGRAEKYGVTLYDSMEDVLAEADIITIHIFETSETMGMFGPEQFAAMKDGVILVNVAFGAFFDVDSLADFVAAGKIGAVGIDMYADEPCTDSPLHEFDNVILTPRLGGNTYEAQLRAGTQIAEFVVDGLSGSVVQTAINMSLSDRGDLTTVGAYVPACQMAGRFIAQVLGHRAHSLKVTGAGSAIDVDSLPILVAGVLDGMYAAVDSRRITLVNAETVAENHGITIDTVKDPDAGEYLSTVNIEADEVEIKVTLADVQRKPRIVSLMGYKIDIAPDKHALVCEYEDVPGRMGVIGTVLGEEGINISTMQIGVKPEASKALVYLNISSAADDALIKRLCDAMPMSNIWSLTF